MGSSMLYMRLVVSVSVWVLMYVGPDDRCSFNVEESPSSAEIGRYSLVTNVAAPLNVGGSPLRLLMMWVLNVMSVRRPLASDG